MGVARMQKRMTISETREWRDLTRSRRKQQECKRMAISETRPEDEIDWKGNLQQECKRMAISETGSEWWIYNKLPTVARMQKNGNF